MSRPSLHSEEVDEPELRTVRAGRGGGGLLLAAVVLLLLGLGGLGYHAHTLRTRTAQLETRLASLSSRMDQSETRAREAAVRAAAAETSARAAAEGRQVAEAETADARQQADAARQEATAAQETAARAQAEAERIRKQAEAEMNRLEKALGEIAETRRTALGLVMNLGSDYLRFEFNKADLRPEDRELLSRIAGILLTAHDYTISVNGHTDDVGSAAYNQALSLRRAEAVRDYLVKSGLPPGIFSVEGHGKSRPLVRGTTDAARARNRRVELGIVNMQVRYQKDRRAF